MLLMEPPNPGALCLSPAWYSYGIISSPNVSQKRPQNPNTLMMEGTLECRMSEVQETLECETLELIGDLQHTMSDLEGVLEAI